MLQHRARNQEFPDWRDLLLSFLWIEVIQYVPRDFLAPEQNPWIYSAISSNAWRTFFTSRKHPLAFIYGCEPTKFNNPELPVKNFWYRAYTAMHQFQKLDQYLGAIEEVCSEHFFNAELGNSQNLS